MFHFASSVPLPWVKPKERDRRNWLAVPNRHRLAKAHNE